MQFQSYIFFSPSSLWPEVEYPDWGLRCMTPIIDGRPKF